MAARRDNGPGRRRGSIRLWQTELFVIVILVAILILSWSLSAGLSSTLTRMAETTELRNASALAQRLGEEFPIGPSGTRGIRDVLAEYRDIYGGGIWVYDDNGELLESASDDAPLDAVLESARLDALDEAGSYVYSDISEDGWVVAAKPIEATGGARDGPAGAVVTASSARQPATILDSVRDRLWITFWASLVVAGLLGFAFSEVIARRLRARTGAAEAIEAGDFDQRLPTTLVPHEVRHLAESYNSMAEQLGATFRAQRRFVADASHELRTPIAALKGMLELLADGAQEKPEVREDFIRTMQTEVDRLGRLVADLLTLAQIDAGNLELSPGPQHVRDLLDEVAGVMRTLADAEDVRLQVEAPAADPLVRADRDRVIQVLLSFTDNAIKHSPPGGRVGLRAELREDAVRFAVTDEGPGIPAGEASRVFERFYRAGGARSASPDATTGTGLGLAIAKEIVETHGSEIVVQSPPDGGTTFAFDLPVV